MNFTLDKDPSNLEGTNLGLSYQPWHKPQNEFLAEDEFWVNLKLCKGIAAAA